LKRPFEQACRGSLKRLFEEPRRGSLKKLFENKCISKRLFEEAL
jgi:hypothetical protein